MLRSVVFVCMYSDFSDLFPSYTETALTSLLELTNSNTASTNKLKIIMKKIIYLNQRQIISVPGGLARS